jgi:hypothetical protein
MFCHLNVLRVQSVFAVATTRQASVGANHLLEYHTFAAPASHLLLGIASAVGLYTCATFDEHFCLVIHAAAGAVGFHSGSGQADSGWGCGFRNIQMQISHQLMRGDAAVRQALFGGCGYVPDIGELTWTAGSRYMNLDVVEWVAALLLPG